MVFEYWPYAEVALTSKLSDPAHRTLSKPGTHGTTETQKPGSLKRMVRRRCTHISKNIQPTLSREPEMMSGLAAAHSNSTRRPRRTRGKKSASFCVFCGQRISPSHQKAGSRRTSRLTDPAPATPGMQLRRYRGVRCSRFVRRSKVHHSKNLRSRSLPLRGGNRAGARPPAQIL